MGLLHYAPILKICCFLFPSKSSVLLPHYSSRFHLPCFTLPTRKPPPPSPSQHETEAASKSFVPEAATTASSSSLISRMPLLLHPLAGRQSSVSIFGQWCLDSSYSVGHQYERGKSVLVLLHCLTSLYKK
ncbi:hypothetical protein V6Z11_D01G196100, partial [Gossypium hirsutum]